MTPRRFRWLVNLWPPFLAAGIRVLAVAPDWRWVHVRLRRHFFNANYVGTHFGGSLFAMTDPFWMIMVMENLGRDYLVWDKAAEIEFVAALKGDVFAEFRLEPAVLEELRTAAAGGEKVLRWFEVEVRAANGEVAARVRKQVYVRLKARVRGRGAGPGV
jgi:acyl-coenzyme A thioesterase PaaI-like protein